MTALFELALAVAAQFAMNRQLASLRAESQQLMVSLTVFLAACLVALTGVGFLLVALYVALLESYDPPIAAAIEGGTLLVLAGSIVAVSLMRSRLRAARASAIPTLPARLVAEKEAEAVMDEFKNVLASASPVAIAAAIAGLAVGIAGAKIGEAVRANGARR